MATVDFEKIEFNPTTKELSIIKDNSVFPPAHAIGSPIDLSTTAVKLKVLSSNEVEFTTGTFSTEKFELKLKLKGAVHGANMGFGALKTTINDMPIYPLDQTNSNKFHLSWIGSDDIRVNVVAPSGLLLMENQILSFKIEDNDKFLVIRYHDAI